MGNGKIKILQVCAIDETVKSLLLPLIDRLVKEGFDVTTCCSEGKNSEVLKAKGYKIVNIPIARSIHLISNLQSVLRLRKLMLEEQFDIVHVHTPIAAILGRFAAKMAKVPVVLYTAHGFYFHDRMSAFKYKMLVTIEKLAGRVLTDYIFTQSEEDRQTAIKEKIIDPEKITTIGNGVDIYSRFHPKNIEIQGIKQKRLELGIHPQDKVIMFTGRLVREKGILELLEAFDGMEQENYKLLLVGDRFTAERDTETFEYIKKTTENNPRIITPGRRTDIPDLLALSDIFVLPSYREGMPRSIIEAMAMGKPVVATDIRGCREEVVDEETGYLVPVNSANELKGKILCILENDELRAIMGKKARMRAEELFDEEKVLDKQVEIIHQLITDNTDKFKIGK